MREVVHGDVVAVASALRELPPEGWEARIAEYLIRADAADRYRRRIGRAHPHWGNGSLMGAVLCEAGIWPEPRLSDPIYAEAMVAVLMALIRRKQAVQ